MFKYQLLVIENKKLQTDDEIENRKYEDYTCKLKIDKNNEKTVIEFDKMNAL